MPFGAATLSAICPCPRELSRPGTRTATDTVRGNILTCANMQERLHYDEDNAGSPKRRLRRVACGMTLRRLACRRRCVRAPTIYLVLPRTPGRTPKASYGNTVSSPVIVKLVAPHATLTGQTGAVLAIFAVAALQA